jgi:hypothetical protein
MSIHRITVDSRVLGEFTGPHTRDILQPVCGTALSRVDTAPLTACWVGVSVTIDTRWGLGEVAPGPDTVSLLEAWSLLQPGLSLDHSHGVRQGIVVSDRTRPMARRRHRSVTGSAQRLRYPGESRFHQQAEVCTSPVRWYRLAARDGQAIAEAHRSTQESGACPRRHEISRRTGA